VERARILLHLVDVSEMAPGEPVENLKKLNEELRLYSEALLMKPQAVAGTKCDIKGDGKRLDSLRDYCKTNGIDFFPISSVMNEGIRKLVIYLSEKVAK